MKEILSGVIPAADGADGTLRGSGLFNRVYDFDVVVHSDYPIPDLKYQVYDVPDGELLKVKTSLPGSRFTWREGKIARFAISHHDMFQMGEVVVFEMGDGVVACVYRNLVKSLSALRTSWEEVCSMEGKKYIAVLVKA